MWEKGQLTLGDGAVVQRKLEAGPWVEMEFDLEIPKLKSDGQSSDLKIWLDLDGKTDSFVWLTQKREKGEIRSALRIVDTEGNWNQNLKPQPIFTLAISGALRSGKWSIRYRQGLFTIQGPIEEFLLVGHLNKGAAPVKQIAVTTLSAPVQIRSAEFEVANRIPFRPTPEVVTKLKEATTLTQKLIQLYRAGRAKEAAEIGKTIRAIRLRHLGRFHSDYAASVNNLAAMYRATSNYTQAEPLYVEAKLINEKVLGKRASRLRQKPEQSRIALPEH